MEDSNFVVYAHYTLDTNELFYIGEDRLNRAYSKHSRNKYWKHKVQKHSGFTVKVIYSSLSKTRAEILEERLIRKLKHRGIPLVNFCLGPMFKNHWLAGAPKEIHPMYGKKRPDSSKRMSIWNKE